MPTDRTTPRRWTPALLLLLSVAILSAILALVPGSTGRLDTPVPPPPPPHGTDSAALDPLDACELERRAERQWRAFRERLVREELPETKAAIRHGIDMAFAPIYTGIPAFLDWHYSVTGQYAQLGQAALGTLQEEFSARLFAGLRERVASASADVDQVMGDELRRSIRLWARNEGQTLPTEALSATYQGILDTVVTDTVSRFTATAVPSGVAAAGAGATGMVAAGALRRGLTRRLAASATGKAAGRAGARLGSRWGTAMVGAAVGAVIGPVGAAISGVLAAAAAWLALDSAFVNIDEYLNRSSFERDLIGLVDESRTQIETALATAVDAARTEALGALGSLPVTACAEESDGAAPGTLDGRTPSELSAPSAQRHEPL